MVLRMVITSAAANVWGANIIQARSARKPLPVSAPAEIGERQVVSRLGAQACQASI
jgi:hypothetical protein